MAEKMDLIKDLVKTDLNCKGRCCGIEGGDSVVVPFSDGNVRIQISEEPEDGALDRPPATGCWEDAKGVVHRWQEAWRGEKPNDEAFEFYSKYSTLSGWKPSANPGVKPYTPCEDPEPKPEPRPRNADTRKWMRETGRHLTSSTFAILWRWNEEQGIYQAGCLGSDGDVAWVPSLCQDEPIEIYVPADGLPW